MEGKAVVQKQEAEKVPMEMGSSGGVIEGQVTEPLAWMLKAIKM
jgi:hypothetical protein